MRRPKLPIVTAMVAATLCSSSPVSADASAATHSLLTESRKCKISGWTAASADASYVLVRSKPSSQARVAGKLPTIHAGYAGPKPHHRAEFDIVENHNGWFRISNVRIIVIRDGSYGFYPSPIDGWIEPSAIRFHIQSSRGFAQPDPDSAVRIRSADWLMDDWKDLYSCNGNWAEVDTSPLSWDDEQSGRPLPPQKAWFRGICGSSMIECHDVLGN